MTAYGRGEFELEGTRFVAEARSFNNRHRDILLRIPKSYQTFEDELRAIVSSRIKRGRIEISIQVDGDEERQSYELELNLPLVKSYLKILGQLSGQYGVSGEIRPEAFLQFKDAVIVKPEEVDIEKMREGFKQALMSSLDSHDKMRKKEGENIEKDFFKRLGLLEDYASQIKERVPVIIAEYSKRINDRVRVVVGELEIDEGRLAQEVAILAEKSDITEELVRIKSHLEQFRKYLTSDDAKGRRLDFLIQEINREVNTTSSKASDAAVSRIVVEMKAELEKLREQAQNVE